MRAGVQPQPQQAAGPCSGSRPLRHGVAAPPATGVAARPERRQQRRRQRRRCAAAALGPPKLEGPLLGFMELLGYTGDDPGHWNFSPEWYGTQGGGWGRNEGTPVFAADSACGNGRVTVTAHPAAAQPSSGAAEAASSSGGGWEEWRVLRFNDVTRQSVMRVHVVPASDPSASSSGSSGSSSSLGQVAVQAQPDCLAQEYLKTVAAVAAALLGLQRLAPGEGALPPRRLRVLCIGVGGGSLPLFLAHHFPGMDVDAVELDPAVVAAATQAMGLPTSRPNLRLHCADGAAFLAQRQGQGGGGRQVQQAQQVQQQPYDLLFMDTFDGEDQVPAALTTPEFAAAVAAALHPAHGCFLLNLHSMEEASGQGRGGAAAAAFRDALLGARGAGGSAFAVAAQRQRNACVAVARGLALPEDRAAARRWLFFEAARVGEAAGFRFPVGSRACRDYQPLLPGGSR